MQSVSDLQRVLLHLHRNIFNYEHILQKKKKIKGKNVYLPKKGSGKYIANPY